MALSSGATGSASAGSDRSTGRASGTQTLALLKLQCHPAARFFPDRAIIPGRFFDSVGDDTDRRARPDDAARSPQPTPVAPPRRSTLPVASQAGSALSFPPPIRLEGTPRHDPHRLPARRLPTQRRPEPRTDHPPGPTRRRPQRHPARLHRRRQVPPARPGNRAASRDPGLRLQAPAPRGLRARPHPPRRFGQRPRPPPRRRRQRPDRRAPPATPSASGTNPAPTRSPPWPTASTRSPKPPSAF